jgi:tetratricopeptide (TPR) repeat protein
MLRRTREELHRQAAAAIEQLHADGDDVLDELARHHYLGRTPQALRVLLRAGERARSLYANHEALLHLRRALELVREQGAARELEAGVLLDLADVLDIVGDYPQAADRYADAVALTSDVRAYAGQAAMLRKQNKWADALGVLLTAATERVAGDDRELWAARASIEANRDNYRAALDAAERGRALAPEATDATAGRLLVWIARSHSVLGDLDAAIAAGHQAVDAFISAGAVGERCRAERMLGYAYTRAERYDEATKLLISAIEVARRIGDGYEVGQGLANLAVTEHSRGHYAEAARLDREAIAEFRRVASPYGEAVAGTNLAETLFELGEVDEAIEWCERTLEVAHRIDSTLAIADTTRTLARIAATRQDFSAAAKYAGEAATAFESAGSTQEAESCRALAEEYAAGAR